MSRQTPPLRGFSSRRSPEHCRIFSGHLRGLLPSWPIQRKYHGKSAAKFMQKTGKSQKNKKGETQGRGKDTNRISPSFVHALSFSLEETGTDQTNPIF